MKSVHTEFSTTAYSQALVYTAEWTGAIRVKKLAQGSTHQQMIQTRVLLVESPKHYYYSATITFREHS